MRVCFVNDGDVCTAILVDTIQLNLQNVEDSKCECYTFSEQHSPATYGWYLEQEYSSEQEYKILLKHLESIYGKIEVVNYFRIINTVLNCFMRGPSLEEMLNEELNFLRK